MTRAWYAVLPIGLLVCGLAAPAIALDDPIGIWNLSEPGTNLQCRLQLRADAAATGQAVAMPPGCRRAFPILAGVKSWSVPDGVHLAFDDERGVSILMFAEAENGQFQASGPEGDHAYLLAALGTHAKTPVAPAGAAPPAVTTVAAPVVEPVPRRAALSPTAVAGHYAVMRGARDTGCMVTLDEAGRASQAVMKARLAPACRDQGISIFDPIGWALKPGHLVLQARKGHTAEFSQDEAGVWLKDDKGGGQPLGLKRL